MHTGAARQKLTLGSATSLAGTSMPLASRCHQQTHQRVCVGGVAEICLEQCRVGLDEPGSCLRPQDAWCRDSGRNCDMPGGLLTCETAFHGGFLESLQACRVCRHGFNNLAKALHAFVHWNLLEPRWSSAAPVKQKQMGGKGVRDCGGPSGFAAAYPFRASPASAIQAHGGPGG